MEIVTGTATGLVGKILGFVESAVGRQVGYLIHYKRNLENLKTEVSKLSAAKETVSEKITVAEEGEKIYSDVRVWLENVAKITKEAQQLLKDKQQASIEDANNSLKDDGQPKTTKCVRGFCPNPMLRRRQSKKSLALVVGVTELINEGKQLSDISYVPPKGPKDLETEVGKLRVAKDTLAENVAAAEVKGEKIHANVLDWLKRVAEITEAAEEFLKDKHQSIEEDEIQATEKPDASPSHGSKELLELLQEVTGLYENREFYAISYVLPAEDECIASDEDYEKFDSRTSMLEKILEELRSSSSSDMILVYGVGGVGKTTLVEEVLRKAKNKKLFQDALMVRDVKVPNLEAIQKQIADKLGLTNILEAHTLPGRADKINERIKNNNTLVIFDDVWGEIDFKAVGLPHKSTCRILLTSRSKQVFSYKIKQKEFPLGVLDDKEAWALFEKKAGDVVADPAIQPVVTQVAQKCGGLPVLLITVARALENKPLPIWKDALLCLKKFDGKEDLTEKAYSGIEWSYSQLSNKKLQSLFLLCGSIAQGNYISLKILLAYGIGLEFFEDYTVEAARNALYQRVDKLKSSCLLLDGNDGTCVRIHDLVRDVANSISRRDQHALVVVVDGSHELKKWPNEGFFVQCRRICLACCKVETLPQESWKCPQLELFHWDGGDGDDENENEDDDVDSSPAISNKFFEEMRKLKVLGLRCVPLPLLPSSLKFLKNLQTLCLDDCDFKDTDLALVGELSNLEVLSMVDSMIKQLPQEFGQLTRLRLVDVSDNYGLEVIPAGVISKWTNLEELRLRNSFKRWDGAKRFLSELEESESELEESESEKNASLSELMDLPKLTALEVHIPDASILPPKFFSDRLEKYKIFLGGVYMGRMDETTLNTVKLKLDARFELAESLKVLLKRCEVFALNAGGGDFSILMKVVTSNLTTLNVSDCGGLKYLFTSFMVRSLVKLKRLEVSGCRDMEEIVLSTRESHQEEEEDVDIIFAKLESLKLNELPNLARFCTAGSCIDFPLLEELYIWDCSKLGERATGWGNVLFDEKVRCPRLEILEILNSVVSDHEERVLENIWDNELAPGSFCRLRDIRLSNCSGVESIFPPSMMGRLSGLETLEIRECASVRVLFDETNVKETDRNTTNNLKDGQNLKSVDIYECDKLKYVFPASMGRSLVKLKRLEVSCCRDMEEIVLSTRESHQEEEDVDIIFAKLESLALWRLPNLARFCTAGSCIDFPLLVKLNVDDCSKLGERATGWGNVLFDEKVRCPILEIINYALSDREDRVLKNIWHNQLAPDSFCRLREIHLYNCSGVESIFPPSMMGRLSGLETLTIRRCVSVRVIFDETNVKETDSKTTNNLKDGQNLKSVQIDDCDKLKYVFPASMVTRGLQQLQQLEAINCSGMENVVGKEEGAVESTKHPRFIFPKVKRLTFDSMRQLKSFYPEMHTSEWPSLQSFECYDSSLEIFAAEVSVFQEAPLPPTKQPFFLIDKDSFPVLEELVLPRNSEILYCPSSSPIESMFPKLNSNTGRAVEQESDETYDIDEDEDEDEDQVEEISNLEDDEESGYSLHREDVRRTRN